MLFFMDGIPLCWKKLSSTFNSFYLIFHLQNHHNF